MNIVYWLKRPQLIGSRIRYRLWELAHPDEPWLCPETVALLRNRLDPSMTALEFGSGRSTRWLARRIGSLTSIEYDPVWHARVKEQLQDVATAVSLRCIALDHPHSEPERENYDPLPKYVSVLTEFKDHSLDLVVVDGHYRTTVLRHCGTKLRAGGLLLIDDVNLWAPGAPPIPRGFQLFHRATNGIKITDIWRAPAN